MTRNDIDQTALAATQAEWAHVPPGMVAEIVRAYLGALPAAPLPEEVERLAKELRFLVSLNEPQKGGPYEGFAAEQCVKSMARAANLLTQQAQALADAETRLPRLTDDMMRAAARAHFASDNIDGIGMTANGIDYSFRQAFTRMWSGIRRFRGGNND